MEKDPIAPGPKKPHLRHAPGAAPSLLPPAVVSEADFCHFVGNSNAASAILSADISAMLLLCKHIAEAAGVDEVEGLGVIDWFNRQRRVQLERNILAIGDTDPPLAEHLQRHLGRLRDLAGPDSIVQPPED